MPKKPSAISSFFNCILGSLIIALRVALPMTLLILLPEQVKAVREGGMEPFTPNESLATIAAPTTVSTEAREVGNIPKISTGSILSFEDYATFLNLEEKFNPGGVELFALYDEEMVSDPTLGGGIVREGEPGSYHYIVTGCGSLPVCYVSKLDLLRYANFMENLWEWGQDEQQHPGDQVQQHEAWEQEAKKHQDESPTIPPDANSMTEHGIYDLSQLSDGKYLNLTPNSAAHYRLVCSAYLARLGKSVEGGSQIGDLSADGGKMIDLTMKSNDPTSYELITAEDLARLPSEYRLQPSNEGDTNENKGERVGWGQGLGGIGMMFGMIGEGMEGGEGEMSSGAGMSGETRAGSDGQRDAIEGALTEQMEINRRNTTSTVPYAEADAGWQKRQEVWGEFGDSQLQFKESNQQAALAEASFKKAEHQRENPDQTDIGKVQQTLESAAKIAGMIPLPPGTVAGAAIGEAAKIAGWVNLIWVELDYAKAAFEHQQAQEIKGKRKERFDYYKDQALYWQREAKRLEMQSHQSIAEQEEQLAKILTPNKTWGEREWQEWINRLSEGKGWSRGEKEARVTYAQTHLEEINGMMSKLWKERLERAKNAWKNEEIKMRFALPSLSKSSAQAQIAHQQKEDEAQGLEEQICQGEEKIETLKKEIAKFAEDVGEGKSDYFEQEEERENWVKKFQEITRLYRKIEKQRARSQELLKELSPLNQQRWEHTKAYGEAKHHWERVTKRALEQYRSCRKMGTLIWPDIAEQEGSYREWEFPEIECEQRESATSEESRLTLPLESFVDPILSQERFKKLGRVRLDAWKELQKQAEKKGQRGFPSRSPMSSSVGSDRAAATDESERKEDLGDSSTLRAPGDVVKDGSSDATDDVANNELKREFEAAFLSDPIGRWQKATDADRARLDQLEEVDRAQRRYQRIRKEFLAQEKTEEPGDGDDKSTTFSTVSGTLQQISSLLTGRNYTSYSGARRSSYGSGGKRNSSELSSNISSGRGASMGRKGLARHPVLAVRNLAEEMSQANKEFQRQREEWKKGVREADGMLKREGSPLWSSDEEMYQVWEVGDRALLRAKRVEEADQELEELGERKRKKWVQNRLRWEACQKLLESEEAHQKEVENFKAIDDKYGLGEISEEEYQAGVAAYQKSVASLEEPERLWRELAIHHPNINRYAERSGEWQTNLQWLKDRDKSVCRRWQQFQEEKNRGKSAIEQEEENLDRQYDYQADLESKLQEALKQHRNKKGLFDQKKYQRAVEQLALEDAARKQVGGVEGWRALEDPQELAEEFEAEAAESISRGAKLFAQENQRLRKIEKIWQAHWEEESYQQQQKVEEAVREYWEGEPLKWCQLSDEQRGAYNKKLAEQNQHFFAEERSLTQTIKDIISERKQRDQKLRERGATLIYNLPQLQREYDQLNETLQKLSQEEEEHKEALKVGKMNAQQWQEYQKELLEKQEQLEGIARFLEECQKGLVVEKEKAFLERSQRRIRYWERAIEASQSQLNAFKKKLKEEALKEEVRSYTWSRAAEADEVKKQQEYRNWAKIVEGSSPARLEERELIIKMLYADKKRGDTSGKIKSLWGAATVAYRNALEKEKEKKNEVAHYYQEVGKAHEAQVQALFERNEEEATKQKKIAAVWGRTAVAYKNTLREEREGNNEVVRCYREEREAYEAQAQALLEGNEEEATKEEKMANVWRAAVKAYKKALSEEEFENDEVAYYYREQGEAYEALAKTLLAGNTVEVYKQNNLAEAWERATRLYEEEWVENNAEDFFQVKSRVYETQVVDKKIIKQCEIEQSHEEAREAYANALYQKKSGNYEIAGCYLEEGKAYEAQAQALLKGNEEEARKQEKVGEVWGEAARAYHNALKQENAGSNEMARYYRGEGKAYEAQAQALLKGNEEEARKQKKVGEVWGEAARAYHNALKQENAGSNEMARYYRGEGKAYEAQVQVLLVGNKEEAAKQQKIAEAWSASRRAYQDALKIAWYNAGLRQKEAREARGAGDERGVESNEKAAVAFEEWAKLLEAGKSEGRVEESAETKYQKKIGEAWLNAGDRYKEAREARGAGDTRGAESNEKAAVSFEEWAKLLEAGKAEGKVEESAEAKYQKKIGEAWLNAGNRYKEARDARGAGDERGEQSNEKAAVAHEEWAKLLEAGKAEGRVEESAEAKYQHQIARAWLNAGDKYKEAREARGAEDKQGEQSNEKAAMAFEEWAKLLEAGKAEGRVEESAETKYQYQIVTAWYNAGLRYKEAREARRVGDTRGEQSNEKAAVAWEEWAKLLEAGKEEERVEESAEAKYQNQIAIAWLNAGDRYKEAREAKRAGDERGVESNEKAAVAFEEWAKMLEAGKAEGRVEESAETKYQNQIAEAQWIAIKLKKEAREARAKGDEEGAQRNEQKVLLWEKRAKKLEEDKGKKSLLETEESIEEANYAEKIEAVWREAAQNYSDAINAKINGDETQALAKFKEAEQKEREAQELERERT